MAPSRGTVRARLSQLEVRPGAPRENAARMRRQIAAARADGVSLLVFPELAVPGRLLGDEWERPAFLRECEAAGEEIVAAADGIVVVFGNVAVDRRRRGNDGRPRRHTAIFVAEDRRLLAPEGDGPPWIAKCCRRGGGFDDDRHFFSGARPAAAGRGGASARLCAPVATARAGVLGVMPRTGAGDDDDPLPAAGRTPAADGARLLIAADSSPFARGRRAGRHRLCGSLARATGLPLLYVNAVGVQDNGKTVYTFDGGTAVYDSRGELADMAPAFTEAVLTCGLPPSRRRPPSDPGADGTPRVAAAILHGAGVFMRRLGVRRLVTGVSGGLDSAVVAALCRRLLPPEDLLLLSLPGPYTSPTTRRLARRLAEGLGARFAELPISPGVELTRAQFAALVTEGPGGGAAGTLALDPAALENVQARDRGGRILAAAAAAFGGVVCCNANKSELTVGYGTLHGDIIGWLAMIGDLWKGEVLELGRHLNETEGGRPAIPEEIFALRPSAELSAAQDVERGLGDPLVYPYHDKLFRAWVERRERATPEDILEWRLAGTLEGEIGYEGRLAELFPDAAAFVADLERWWSLHQGLAVAKRLQAPPVMAVSRRAYGADLREAQLGPRCTTRYRTLRRQVLRASWR